MESETPLMKPEEYRLLLENSRDIIIIFDRECRPVYINREVSSPKLLQPQEAIIGTAFELGLPVEITPFWKDFHPEGA